MKTAALLRCLAAPFIALTIGSIAACGGSGAEPVHDAEPGVDFRVVYQPWRSRSLLVGGAIEAANGKWPDDVAQVEFLLFGHEAEVLTAPTFGPKAPTPGVPVMLYYVFRFPDSFMGNYPCNGEHLSEVRVTGKNGTVRSKTFEICLGTPLEVPATSPS